MTGGDGRKTINCSRPGPRPGSGNGVMLQLLSQGYKVIVECKQVVGSRNMVLQPMMQVEVSVKKGRNGPCDVFENRYSQLEHFLSGFFFICFAIPTKTRCHSIFIIHHYQLGIWVVKCLYKITILSNNIGGQWLIFQNQQCQNIHIDIIDVIFF